MEKSFFEDNKQGKMTVICGMKGSGKTYLALNFVRIAFYYQQYQKYVFVIPEIDNEADDQYEFLKHHKDVEIYKEFDVSLLEYVKELTTKYRVLFICEDASEYLFKNKASSELLKLVTTLRHGGHGGCTAIFIVHSLKNILYPHTRAMIDHLFVSKYTNQNIIKNQLWLENFSLIMDYDEFLSQYMECIVRQKHNFLYFNRDSEYDFHVDEWALSKIKDIKLKPNGKSQIKNVDKDKKIIERIKQNKHKNELKNKYDPKPEKIPKRRLRKNNILL